jgi:hypothetical protein
MDECYQLPPCPPCEHGRPRLKIECVIVCVNYGDYLAWTLPLNLRHFDKIVVVTTFTDTQTQDLCKFYDVECVVTHSFYQGGAKFKKSCGINEGLARLDRDGWAVHMDADIVLPPRAREILHKVNLDPANIYGIDRMMCESFEAWLRYFTHPRYQLHEENIFIKPNAFETFGVRVGLLGKDEYADGYAPIGFFQLWNPQGSRNFAYTVEHESAGKDDMLFALRWKRRQRHLLPEIIAIHLESEPPLKMGANWSGRTTPAFLPAGFK